MAHIREVFPTLIDATGEGVAYDAKQEGDSPASSNGSIGYSFKDSSGNVVLPQLDSAGRVAVTFDTGTCSKAQGSATPTGLGAGNAEDVATLVLSASQLYKAIDVVGACFTEAVWSLVWIDDVGGVGTETILTQFITGPGSYTVDLNLGCTEFTSGGTGVQHLVLRGYNLKKESDLLGNISALAVA